jgi:Holliday junction resolvase RusA-like endonuclease
VIRLSLPEPPSANRYWRRAGTTIHRSTEATRYIELVALHVRLAGVRKISGSVELRMVWYRKNRTGDLDNRIKVVQDALQHGAFADDGKVRRLVAEMSDDDPRNPRLEVVVIPFVADPAATLLAA